MTNQNNDHLGRGFIPHSSAVPVQPPVATAGVPSVKAQSWGAIISIIIIVAMIIGGAYYAWDKRVAQQRTLTPTTIPF